MNRIKSTYLKHHDWDDIMYWSVRSRMSENQKGWGGYRVRKHILSKRRVNIKLSLHML
jgi:hypothetical protein